MNPREPIDPRLMESLSAYLDGKLEGAERAALEKHLEQEEELRRHLAELRAVRDSLRSLPVVKPPRPLTLSPAQAGTPARRSVAFSPRTMAWGSALATLAFAAVLSVDVFSRGFVMGAATRPPVLEAMRAPEASGAGQTGPGEGSGDVNSEATMPMASAPTLARVFQAPTQTTSMPKAVSEPSVARDTVASEEDAGCGMTPLNSSTDSIGCIAPVEPAEKQDRYRLSLPDFQTAAPYLEAILGALAVILVVLAVIFRRPR
jgi:anti-sigma factor RsiW